MLSTVKNRGGPGVPACRAMACFGRVVRGLLLVSGTCLSGPELSQPRFHPAVTLGSVLGRGVPGSFQQSC